MKAIYHICFMILLGFPAFGSESQDSDLQSKKLLQSQIEDKYQQRLSECIAQKTPYLFFDYDKTCLNFSSHSCPYCQSHESNRDLDLEEKMKASGFLKIKSVLQRKDHDMGTALFFVKYLITHPQIKSQSCAQILAEVLRDPDFQQSVHEFSMNRYYDYFLENKPLEFGLGQDPVTVKRFFQILMEETPVDYCFLPKFFSEVIDLTTIYEVLQKFSNRFVIVEYESYDRQRHFITVSSDIEKLFFFEPNLGLFQFVDLENMSWYLDKILEGSQIYQTISFDSSMDCPE